MSTTTPVDPNDTNLGYEIHENNQAFLIKAIVNAFQKGILVPDNASKLQNLTPDDIIQLAKEEIENNLVLPDIGSHVITGPDGEITNVIDYITQTNILRDTTVEVSDYLEFKLIEEEDPLQNKIIVTVPFDLTSRDKVISVVLTQKMEEVNPETEKITTTELFDYDFIPVISGDNTIVQKTKHLNIGTIEVRDNTSHPFKTELHGKFGNQFYIKVVYLKDLNAVSNSTKGTGTGSPPPYVIPPGASVMTQQYSEPIEFVYGMNEDPDKGIVHEEAANFLDHENNKIIEKIDEKPVISNEEKSWILNGKLPNNAHLMRIIEQMEINDIPFQFTPVEFANLLDPENNKIIEQDASTALDKIMLNYVDLHDSVPNEAVNLLIFPRNKIIDQLDFTVVSMSRHSQYYKSVVKIIEQVEASTINFSNKFTVESSDIYLKTGSTGLTPFQPVHVIAENKKIIEFDSQTDEMKFERNSNLIDTKIKVIEQLDDYFEGQEQNSFLPLNLVPKIHEEKANFITTNIKIIEPLPEHIQKFIFRERANFIPVCAKIIEQTNQDSFDILELVRNTNYLKDNIKIIEAEENQERMIFRERANFLPYGTKIIEQENQDMEANNFFVSVNDDINSVDKKFKANDLVLKDLGIKIIEQISYIPAIMQVTSGTPVYLKDVRNQKIVSTYNTPEFVSLLDSDQVIKESSYEIWAKDNQQVFECRTNVGSTIVYREGWRLGQGDYYNDGNKIILKSPANQGELIIIISRKKFNFADAITKEDLHNYMTSIKTETPQILYPVVAYEGEAMLIKILNWNIANMYKVDISLNQSGFNASEVNYKIVKDEIFIQAPNIENVDQRTLQLTIVAMEPNKLISNPMTVTIGIKNSFGGTSGTSEKIVFGDSLTQGSGIKYSLEEKLDSLSQFISHPASVENNTPKMIEIEAGKKVKSVLVREDTFSSDIIYPSIGLADINKSDIKILRTGLTETLFQLESGDGNWTYSDIDQAHANGTLFFVLDTQLDIGGGLSSKGKFYRSDNFVSKLSYLPLEDTDGNGPKLLLEHNEKLKNRYIHRALIIDLELMVDYDDRGSALIPEDGTDGRKLVPFESMEYFVGRNKVVTNDPEALKQAVVTEVDVPLLKFKINSEEIRSTKNPFINDQSDFTLDIDNDVFSLPGVEPLKVNNITGSEVFSGLKKDVKTPDNATTLNTITAGKLHYHKQNEVRDADTTTENFIVWEEELAGTPTKNQLTWYSFIDKGIPGSTIQSTEIIPIGEIEVKQNAFNAVVSFSNTKIYTDQDGIEWSTNSMFIEYGGDVLETVDTIVNLDGSTTPQRETFIDNSIRYRFIYTRIQDGQRLFKLENPIEVRQPSIWDMVFRPGLKPVKELEINHIFSLITQELPEDDIRWQQLSVSALRKGMVSTIDGINDHDICSPQNKNGFFAYGGSTYRTKIEEVSNDRVLPGQGVLVQLQDLGDSITSFVEMVYARRNSYSNSETGYVGYRNKDAIADIQMDIHNGQPRIKIRWLRSRYVQITQTRRDGVVYLREIHITREPEVNKHPRYINAANIDIYSQTPVTDDQYSDAAYFHSNKIIPDFMALYNNPNSISVNDQTQRAITSPASLTDPLIAFKQLRFEQIISNTDSSGGSGNKLYMIIKPAFSDEPKLIEMDWNYFDPGGANIISRQTEINNTNFNIITDVPNGTWKMVPDPTTSLRGDGPLMINTVSSASWDSTSHDTSNPEPDATGIGIYHLDTWDNSLVKKSHTPIRETSIILPQKELPNIKDPYLSVIDSNIKTNELIILNGSIIWVVAYLDKILSQLNADQTEQFLEDLLLLDAGTQNKHLGVLPNPVKAKVLDIIADNRDPQSKGAQVIFFGTPTQNQRNGRDLIFQLKNTSPRSLFVDAVRFWKNPTNTNII